MILWGRPSSVNVQKVLWALVECDQPFEHKVVGGKYGGLDTESFAALSPVGRVPVLQDGDVTLWESHAILRYLASKSRKLQVTPQADMWMEFGSTTLQPPFIEVFWQRVRMTPAQQDSSVLAKQLQILKVSLAILNRGLSDGRAFVAGSEFTMADVALGSLFHRITDLCPGILDPLSHVAQWHGAVATRSGYMHWIATSYNELRVLR